MRPRIVGLLIVAVLLGATAVVAVRPHGSVGAAAVCAPGTGSAPAGNLTDFRQTFRSDFSRDAAAGSFLSTYPDWRAYPTTYITTDHNGHYHPENLTVSAGVLHLNLKPGDGTAGSAQGNAPYPAPSTGLNHLYRRTDVCFQDDNVANWHQAWLLWPASGVWPRDGEIDFPELNLDGTVNAFMHRQGGTSPSDQDAYLTGLHVNDGKWHLATTIWNPYGVAFLLDDHMIGHSTARIPNTPMHWVLQTETAGVPTSPADVRVAWVTVYDYSPGCCG